MILECDIPVQLHILSFLSHPSIASCESVCSHFKHLVLSINYWQVLCEKHGNYKLLISRKEQDTWKNFYRRLLSVYPCAIRRIQRELRDFHKEPPPYGFSFEPSNNDILLWTASIVCYEGTPYEGGTFHLDISFPGDYPFNPPKVTFTTPILHCNITADGEISLDVLSSTSWSPALTISKIFLCIFSLLRYPNPDAAVVPELGALYKADRNAYHERVSAHVKQFAVE